MHKAQGSEFERVLLALPERDARVLTRELLYTGLTRCRREVTLWGSEDVLRCALGRRAARWSGLAAKLAPLPAVSPGSVQIVDAGAVGSPQGNLF